jgi:methylthioribulose-1-phosphate dehydratase
MARKRKVKAKTGQTARAQPSSLAASLAKIGREFHTRGWALGTSGNYSALLQREPLQILITSSGLDKSELGARNFLEIDSDGSVLAGNGRPSAETLLHLAVVQATNAGCVLHTHSAWNTLLSEKFAERGGVALEGYEMLKGLEGVKTHEHREWIPIFKNSQDIAMLAEKVTEYLGRDLSGHGFLLGGHGLYTWGQDVAQARRHVEIFEFLFEVVGRRKFSELSGTTN